MAANILLGVLGTMYDQIKILVSNYIVLMSIWLMQEDTFDKFSKWPTFLTWPPNITQMYTI